MKRLLHCHGLILLAALLFLALCTCAQAEAAPKKVTVMVYMCGSDLESESAAATRVLGEMRAARYNQEAVNVVALLGGSTRWWSGYDSNSLSIVQVDGSRKPPVVQHMKWASMGDPATLSSFLTYCHDNFPAERNILILWDHGGGPIDGVCYDRIAEKKERRTDTLTTPELDAGLKNSPFADRGLDIVAFHACLMGSAEVANRIAPYARYMVASEEINYGMGYDWLKGVEDDPDVRETAVRIVDASFAYNARINDTLANVFAAVDLGGMSRLNEAMDAFFTHLASVLDTDSFTSLSTARGDVEVFGASGDGTGSDLVDLGDLVAKYRFAVPDDADALLTALGDVVVHHQSSTEACTGLSVYHPYLNKYGVDMLLPTYGGLGFSSGYTAFVQQFATILTGKPLTDWTGLSTTCDVPDRAASIQFKLALTDDQAANFASATLAILQQTQDSAYRVAYVGNNVTCKDGALVAEFKNRALYAVDDAGNPISDALEYSITGDGLYAISAVLSREAGQILSPEGDLAAAWDAGSHNAVILCALDPVTLELVPQGLVRVRDGETGLYTTAYGTAFSDYQGIQLQLVTRRLPAEGTDPLPPFSEWEIASSDTWEAAIDGSWRFRLLEDCLPTDDLCAAWQVTDTQNNRYSSAPFSLAVNDAEYRIFYDDKAFDIEPDSFQLTVRDDLLTPALIMRYKLDQPVYMMMEHVLIEGQTAEGAGEAYGDGANGAFRQGDRVSLSAECSLPALPDGDIKNVAFDINLYDAESDELILTVPVTVTRN